MRHTLFGSEVSQVGLFDAIGDDVVGRKLFIVAKDLNLFAVCHHDSFLIELKGLAEAFGASLAEANVFVPDLSPRLKEWGHGAALNHFHFNGQRRLLLANCACRSLVFIVACVKGVNFIFV